MASGEDWCFSLATANLKRSTPVVFDMNDKRKTTVSKYLSKHLRHEPEALGLNLQPGGWVSIDDLLDAATKHGFPITPAELDEVVRTSPKQRFSFDETATLIRANQGHSTAVDLQLEPAEPPPLLFHGTGSQTAPFILADGLMKMLRHHVHLSADVDTARRVGMRHGKPAIFQIDAAKMIADGYTFFVSANGVWLTEAVPPAYLSLLGQAASGD
jgi:putative RNA 2'-phosphotransferase